MPIARRLVDTGVLYGALAATDNRHDACASLLRASLKPLVTTEAIIAELFWLIGTNRHFVRSGWQLVRSGAITLARIDDSDLVHLDALMTRYADRPMDFADATLVHVAEREGISDILTVDHEDFEIYRIGKRGRFRIMPPS